MRYYVRMSPFVLPAVRDRRWDEAVSERGEGGAFINSAHRKMCHSTSRGSAPQAIARCQAAWSGVLKTLLYMTQLAVISQDPWFSRVNPRNSGPCGARSDPIRASHSLRCSMSRGDHVTSLKGSEYPTSRKRREPPGFIWTFRCRQKPRTRRVGCYAVIATIVAKKHPKAATVTRAVQAGAERLRGLSAEYPGETIATRTPPPVRAPMNLRGPLPPDVA